MSTNFWPWMYSFKSYRLSWPQICFSFATLKREPRHRLFTQPLSVRANTAGKINHWFILFGWLRMSCRKLRPLLSEQSVWVLFYLLVMMWWCRWFGDNFPAGTWSQNELTFLFATALTVTAQELDQSVTITVKEDPFWASSGRLTVC